MTPRTPYMQTYYQDHRDTMRRKYRDAYRTKVHKGIGATLEAPGLYKIWMTINGKVEYIGDMTRTRYGYKCAAGYFTTQRAAITAMIKGLEEIK